MWIIASLRPRLSVHGEEPHPTSDDYCAEHSRSKGVNLNGVSAVSKG